ncbi:hypothetical protein [Streptomyces sp. NPDC026092]|uniref:hypothetical protein n=1 Tax=Streptomyces sp. NPDC026092 TaxID=3154797 RepID=UPI0033F13A3E
MRKHTWTLPLAPGSVRAARERTERSLVLYEITYLGAGTEPDVRTVEAREVAAVIEHAGAHGMQILVRPCPRPLHEPNTRKEDAS